MKKSKKSKEKYLLLVPFDFKTGGEFGTGNFLYPDKPGHLYAVESFPTLAAAQKTSAKWHWRSSIIVKFIEFHSGE